MDEHIDTVAEAESFEVEEVKVLSSVLFRARCQKTTGAARRVVKNSAKFDGLSSWRRFASEYDPQLITGAQANRRNGLSMERATNPQDISAKTGVRRSSTQVRGQREK